MSYLSQVEICLEGGARREVNQSNISQVIREGGQLLLHY